MLTGNKCSLAPLVMSHEWKSTGLRLADEYRPTSLLCHAFKSLLRPRTVKSASSAPLTARFSLVRMCVALYVTYN